MAMSGVLLATFAAIQAHGQEEASDDGVAEVELQEIVVTGTLIRGVEVTGSQTIGIDREKIVEIGALTTNELLGSLPQVSNFFNQRAEQDPRGAGRLTVNRPNLRNLPGINSASGATTLILVDGHRMAPVGVDQSSFDPDLIPGAVIERVEVITDGGSSIYGADAVGGVINFITKDDFEGVEVDLGYDFDGDGDYNALTASITAGTVWENGSGYVSLSTTDREEILNGDRDWALEGNWNGDGTVLMPAGTECIDPVGSITTWRFLNIPGVFSGWTDNPLAGATTTSVGEPCNTSAAGALLPEQERNHVFAGLRQELADNVTLNVKSYYAERSLSLASYPMGDTIESPNPNDLGVTPGDLGGATSFDVAAVGFSYGAHPAYAHRDTSVVIETWGITPELTIELDNGWRLLNTLHYGRSNNHATNPGTNRELAVQAVNDGLLDPANVAAADAELIDDILDFDSVDQSIQELFFLRSIADGAVMDLPAGDLRAAVGFELSQDRARVRQGDVARDGIGSLDFKEDSRDLKSVFAELAIPVFSNLNLSLSVRHDDYSDFGETTNPNIGFTYTPVDWVSIFGHWGESFNAPTVIDRLGTGRILGFFPGAAAIVPDLGQRDPSRTDALLAEGAGGTLLPQTAENWAVGFEVEPLEGLRFNANYYEIEFEDLLGAVNPQSSQAVRLNPNNFIFNPTQQQLDDFLAQLENGDQFTDIDVARLGVIIDRRTSNTDQATLKGIDFGVSYVHDTGFGTMAYEISGNHQIEFDLIQGGNVIDQLESNSSDLSLAGSVNWSRDNVRASLRLKYSNGFDTDVAVNQTSVDSFLVTDLFVGYDFVGGSGITEGLSLRLNVDNLFDEDPPIWRLNQQPAYANWTLGRVFKLGVTKAFH